MADTRRDKRAPVSLKVRFKSATFDEFVEHYSSDISRGGIFIKSKKPLSVGTLLKFEFQLKDESRLIHGVGRVVWRREPPSDGQGPASMMPDGAIAGMGIKFIKMDAESRSLVQKIVQSRGDEPGAFEAGPGAEPARTSSKPFFPDAGPAPLPPPEDRTAVRHASEFLAEALAGADEEAAAEAQANAEAARQRTAEIQAAREAAARASDKVSMRGKPSVNAKSAAEIDSGGDAEGEDLRSTVPEQDAEQVALPSTDTELEQARARLALGVAPTLGAVETPLAGLERGAPSARAATSSASPADPAMLLNNVPPAPAIPDEAMEFASTKTNESIRSGRRSEEPGRVESGGRLESGRTSQRTSDHGEPVHDLVRPLQTSAGLGAGDAMLSSHPPESKSRPWPLLLLFFILIASAGAYVIYMNQNKTPATSASEGARATAESRTGEPQPGEAQAAAGNPRPADQQAGIEDTAPQNAEQNANVAISSVPAGATITVDGNAVGQTPATIPLPTGREVMVAVKAPGFAAAVQPVTATANTKPLEFTLDKLAYVLTVTSTPPGARVSVNRQTQRTPGEFTIKNIGARLVVLGTRPGYLPARSFLKTTDFVERDGALRHDLKLTLTRRTARPTAADREDELATQAAESESGKADPDPSSEPKPPSSSSDEPPAGAGDPSPPSDAPAPDAPPSPTEAPAGPAESGGALDNAAP